MALGNKNRIVFCLTAQAVVAGTGSEVDVVGNHIRLPCKAKLVDVDVVAISCEATSTQVIKVYNGTSISATEVATATITTATPRANGTLTAAYKDKIYAKDSEFCLGENGTNAKDTAGLGVTLTFREMEA